MKGSLISVTGFLFITITAFAQTPCSTPTITDGTFSVCQNGTATYTAESGMMDYNWSVSSGNSILSGQGTNTITVRWLVGGSQTVHVIYFSSTNCFPPPPGAVRDVNVIPIDATISPSGTNVLCTGGSVQLSANTGAGLTYQWRLYGTPISGAIASTYQATEGGYYSVVVTNASGCSAISNTTIVTENTITAGTISGNRNICLGTSPSGFLETVQSTGRGSMSYQWQNSPDNISFSDISGATSNAYMPPALTETTYFRLVSTSTYLGVGCSAASNSVTVTVNQGSGGTIAGDQTICAGGDPLAFTETVASTGTALTYQWQVSTDNWTFTNISGATGVTYDVPAGLGSTRYYKRITTSTTTWACTYPSNIITVHVNYLNAGSLDGFRYICSGDDPPTFTVTQPASGSGTLSYQWLIETPGGATTVISGATGASYDPPPMTETTSYIRNVYSSLNGVTCGPLGLRATVVVNKVSGGAILNHQTICDGGDPLAFTNSESPTGSGALRYKWQTSSDGNTFNDIIGPIGITYDVPAGLTETTHYRRFTTSRYSNSNAPECSAASNVLIVSVNKVNTAPLAGDQTICGGGDPAGFTETSPATGSGALLYQWQISTNNSTFSPISGATGATYDIPSGLTGNVYYYNRTTKSRLNGVDCAAPVSNTLTVTINNVTAGSVGYNQTICRLGDPAAFVETAASTGSGAPTYQWQSSTSGIISGATGATYDAPSGFLQTTSYQRIATSTLNGLACSAASAPVVVTLNAVSGGGIASSQTICSGGDPVAFTQTGAATGTSLVYQWQKGYDKLSMTNISGATGITYDVPAGLTITTNYRRRVTSTLNGVSCSDISNTLIITVNAAPSVTADNKTVCKGKVVALTGSPTGGTWSGTGVSGTNFYSSSLAPGNYSVYYTYTNASGCSRTATATVTVRPVPLITSFEGTAAVCPGSYYTYTVYVSGSGYTYTWSKPSNWYVQYQSGNTITLYVPTYNPSYGAVTVTVSNGYCTNQAGLSVYPGYSCGGGGYPYYSYSVSPNPANSEIMVESSSAKESDSPVNIYSLTGTLYKQAVIGRGKDDVTIGTADLPNGVYLVEIRKPDGTSEFKRLVIAH